jgi:uncharacterized protein
MFEREKLKETRRYFFNRHSSNNKPEHYIDTLENLSDSEFKMLENILVNFPHCHKRNIWPNIFAQFNPDLYPKKLLTLAANAFDYIGNTVLGVAAEWGDVNAVIRLISMGANVNAIDHQVNKLALHWAICNVNSDRDPTSFEAAKVVQCLLNHGARTDITCYQGKTPLQFAKNIKYLAAATIIEQHIKTSFIRATTCKFFRDKLNQNVSSYLATFFNLEDALRMARTKKAACKYVSAARNSLKKR